MIAKVLYVSIPDSGIGFRPAILFPSVAPNACSCPLFMIGQNKGGVNAGNPISSYVVVPFASAMGSPNK